MAHPKPTLKPLRTSVERPEDSNSYVASSHLHPTLTYPPVPPSFYSFTDSFLVGEPAEISLLVFLSPLHTSTLPVIPCTALHNAPQAVE